MNGNIYNKASSMNEWLQVHGVNSQVVRELIDLASNYPNFADFPLPSRAPEKKQIELDLTVQQALSQVCLPSLERYVHFSVDETAILEKIQIFPLASSPYSRPHAVFNKNLGKVEIYIDYSSTPSNLLCLAHEVAHAVQMVKLRQNFVPPAQRETCAFLGELMLIDYFAALAGDMEVVPNLKSVWNIENQFYIHTVAHELLQSVEDINSEYHYNFNYFLARIASIYIWRNGESRQEKIQAVFGSIVALPIDGMRCKSGFDINQLPCICPHNQQSIFYTQVGAMIALDVEGFRRGRGNSPPKSIEDLYTYFKAVLQEGLVKIHLSEDNVPHSYETFSSGENGAPTRISKPFAAY